MPTCSLENTCPAFNMFDAVHPVSLYYTEKELTLRLFIRLVRSCWHTFIGMMNHVKVWTNHQVGRLALLFH
jgi:hypothetical protein